MTALDIDNLLTAFELREIDRGEFIGRMLRLSDASVERAEAVNAELIREAHERELRPVPIGKP